MWDSQILGFPGNWTFWNGKVQVIKDVQCMTFMTYVPCHLLQIRSGCSILFCQVDPRIRLISTLARSCYIAVVARRRCLALHHWCHLIAIKGHNLVTLRHLRPKQNCLSRSWLKWNERTKDSLEGRPSAGRACWSGQQCTKCAKESVPSRVTKLHQNIWLIQSDWGDILNSKLHFSW